MYLQDRSLKRLERFAFDEFKENRQKKKKKKGY